MISLLFLWILIAGAVEFCLDVALVMFEKGKGP